MFSRRKKMNVRVFLLLIFVAKNTYALNLTIDLPVNKGKKPVAYYNQNDDKDSLYESAENSKEIDITSDEINEVLQNRNLNPQQVEQNDTVNNGESAGIFNLVPKIPEDLIRPNFQNKTAGKKQKTNKKSVAKLSDKNFPELPCLRDNVNFWLKIYAKYDKNQALVHDKYDLNKIYSIVSLPRRPSEQKSVISEERFSIKNTLISLANKLRHPNEWTFEERRLALLFPNDQLTKENILAATDNIRVQTGLKSQFEQGVSRSMDYIPKIFPLIKKSGLPLDLVFLPHVESSYNARARSKVGASGLWQIMPRTMAVLEGRHAISKRSDPAVSTRAALKLLRDNFEKIQDWPLALTAYNHGQNGILRAMTTTSSNDLCSVIDNYNSPSFKFASTNFYAQFLAARKIALKKYEMLEKNDKSRSMGRIFISFLDESK